MRILMLSWEYPPHIVGGLGAHVGALAPALVRAGAEVQVVTPRWAGGEPEDTLDVRRRAARVKRATAKARPERRKRSTPSKVYRIQPPVASMGNFYADAQQTNLNLEEKAHELFEEQGRFDVIHAHDWLVSFAAASLKRMHKVPLLATIHATERGRGRGYLSGETAQAINGAEWWLCYEAWRVITASEYMANEVMTYFQTPADKIDVVPNGVDTTRFDQIANGELGSFRRTWASDDQRIVFSVGRLVQEKGAHLLVEAAPQVLSEFPSARFVIAGTGSMSEPLRRRVAELGVSDRVSIAGFISDEDRDRLLKVADVAVFPSLYEPFGIVALEAMAARCPVVVSSVGGLAEVVQHQVTGITVYPDNIRSLAWGILETLEHPEAACARAEEAYDLVRAEFSWDHVAQHTLKIYERLAEERAHVKW